MKNSSVEMKSYHRKDKTKVLTFKRANLIASKLFRYLGTPDVQKQIKKVHKPGGSSAEIQAIIEEFIVKLGFKNEAKGLFKEYHNKGLRPDFHLPIGKSGVLIEVERGKTTINNMDLLDFWKCHLCSSANYLFLLVPKVLIQNRKQKGSRKEFLAVSKRLSTFFEEGNYTNVFGVWIFGY